MDNSYYTEVLDNLPFANAVDLYSRSGPRWFAYYLATWFQVRRLFGRPVLPRFAFRLHDRLDSVPRTDVPARALSRWTARIEQLHDIGFQELAYAVADIIGAKQSAVALFVDNDSNTIAVLEWIRMEGGQGIEEQVTLEFQSHVTGDRQIVTGLIAKEHLIFSDAVVPDYIDATFFPDTRPARYCYDQHQARLNLESVIPISLGTEIERYEETSLRMFNHFCQAGYIREISPRELQHVKTLSLPV